MSGGIQIDDRVDCLKDTNAGVKILITNGRRFSWNDPEKCVGIENLYIVNNWDEATQVVDTVLKSRWLLETLDENY